MLRHVRGIAVILEIVVGFATFSFAATASLTITGAERSSGALSDSGFVTITVNGYSETVAYGQFSTPASIASGLAAKFSMDCAGPTNARANGAVITFQLRTKAGTTFTPVSAVLGSNDQTNFPGSSFYVDASSWPLLLPPAAPSRLTLNVNDNSIGLIWTDNASNEQSYAIQRCTGLGCTPFDYVTGLQPERSSYVDSAVQPGSVYRYSVCAVNSAGASCSPPVVIVDDVTDPCPE